MFVNYKKNCERYYSILLYVFIMMSNMSFSYKKESKLTDKLITRILEKIILKKHKLMKKAVRNLEKIFRVDGKVNNILYYATL